MPRWNLKAMALSIALVTLILTIGNSAVAEQAPDLSDPGLTRLKADRKCRMPTKEQLEELDRVFPDIVSEITKEGDVIESYAVDKDDKEIAKFRAQGLEQDAIVIAATKKAKSAREKASLKATKVAAMKALLVVRDNLLDYVKKNYKPVDKKDFKKEGTVGDLAQINADLSDPSRLKKATQSNFGWGGHGGFIGIRGPFGGGVAVGWGGRGAYWGGGGWGGLGWGGAGWYGGIGGWGYGYAYNPLWMNPGAGWWGGYPGWWGNNLAWGVGWGMPGIGVYNPWWGVC